MTHVAMWTSSTVSAAVLMATGDYAVKVADWGLFGVRLGNLTLSDFTMKFSKGLWNCGYSKAEHSPLH